MGIKNISRSPDIHVEPETVAVKSLEASEINSMLAVACTNYTIKLCQLPSFTISGSNNT
jgi:hypothetical protein